MEKGKISCQVAPEHTYFVHLHQVSHHVIPIYHLKCKSNSISRFSVSSPAVGVPITSFACQQHDSSCLQICSLPHTHKFCLSFQATSQNLGLLSFSCYPYGIQISQHLSLELSVPHKVKGGIQNTGRTVFFLSLMSCLCWTLINNLELELQRKTMKTGQQLFT